MYREPTESEELSMSTQQEHATIFTNLHVKGTPVILYNVWDAGSASAVSSQGAAAIALGSHGVANAHGYEDGEHIPLELVFENAKRTVDAVDVPVTLDFETGYGTSPAEVKASIAKVIETGIIGVNIEDQIAGDDRLYTLEEQSARLQAVRAAADEADVDLFINARTDLFKNTPVEQHNDALLDEALEKAQAFKEAGADGFFVPLLQDLSLIKRLCDESPLPVNIIWLDGMAYPSEIAAAGASRISYGPGPYLKMIEWLKVQAKAEL